MKSEFFTSWPECDVPVPGIPIPGNSSFFFDGIGTGIEKNLVPKKVSEPVSKKFWYQKKSRNRSQKILVPKKVSESVSKKFGIEKNIGISLEIFQNISVDLGAGLVPFPGFLQFLYGIGTGLEKNLVPEKVSEPVSKKISTKKSLKIGLEKFWYRQKSRNRSRKNLVS